MKWINQWFGRQRSQARKSRKKVITGDPDPDTWNPNTGFSAQEIFQVKLENALEGTFLRPTLPSSSTALNTSDLVNLSESTSVTAAIALDSVPSAVESAASGKRKRQRKGQPNEKGKGKKSAAPKGKKVVITRTLRSNKQDVTGTNTTAEAQVTQVQATSVKTEILETSSTLRYTPSPVPMSATVNLVDAQVSSNCNMDSRVYPDAKFSNPTNPAMGLAQPTISKTAHNHMLLNIAPPQRSPIPATNTTMDRWTDLTGRLSFSANQFDGMQAPSPGSRTSRSIGKMPAERGHGLRGSFNRPSESQRSTFYQQGPTFHTQFQNRGPWDYVLSDQTIESGSSSQAPDIPLALGYLYDTGPVFPPSIDGLAAPVYSQSLPYYNLRPLAPAFDWENNIPSSPMEFMYPPDEPISMDNIPQAHGEGYPEVMSIHAPFASWSLKTVLLQINYPLNDIAMDILNPSLAPLKHLTNVLDEFKGSDGTYSSLFNEHARGRLTGCLLDEMLVETKPFQAAMGLSLLSKVGHQWEY